jgi:hypothetical protein
LSPSFQRQITVIDVVIRPPSWKSMNIFNKPCTTFLICTDIVYNSIPHHERENHKFPVGHQVLLFPFILIRLLPLNAYPYIVEVRICLRVEKLLKRGEANLSFLFRIQYSYPCVPCPFAILHLCWFIAGRWIGY